MHTTTLFSSQGINLLAVMWMVAMMLLTMGRAVAGESQRFHLFYTRVAGEPQAAHMTIRIGMALLQAASLVIVPSGRYVTPRLT